MNIKEYQNVHSQIEKILIEWNPIGVPESVLFNEYTNYVSEIILTINKNENLLAFIENLLVDFMGLDYDSGNKIQKAEVLNVINKINKVYRVPKQK